MRSPPGRLQWLPDSRCRREWAFQRPALFRGPVPPADSPIILPLRPSSTSPILAPWNLDTFGGARSLACLLKWVRTASANSSPAKVTGASPRRQRPPFARPLPSFLSYGRSSSPSVLLSLDFLLLSSAAPVCLTARSGR